MTTTVTVNKSAIITTLIKETQTAIVQGILDVTVAPDTLAQEQTKTVSSKFGITLANKQVSISSSILPTTISTIHSTSTSTSRAASSTSTTSVSHTVGLTNSGLFQLNNSAKSPNIGLVIGIPIGVIGVALIIVGIWFYLHRQRRNRTTASDAKLRNYYDDKLNYKVDSDGEVQSPYHMRSVFQVRAKQAVADSVDYHSSFGVPGSTFKQHDESDYSLKEPPHGPVDSKWNLNTPLSKWFAKQSTVSSRPSSSGSLSTAPFSPIVVLKEFKLNRSKRSEINERSPILPSFPEPTYFSQSYHLMQKSVSSNESNVSKQVVPADLIRKTNVPRIDPVPIDMEKKKGKHHASSEPKSSKAKQHDKPLPEKPYSQSLMSTAKTQLEGLEQRVYERMIPTTPVADLSRYKNDNIYRVITTYKKNLADELTITEGEYIKILASHTDGWCLAEKVDKHGSVLAMGEGYLNDGRGLLPELCLEGV